MRLQFVRLGHHYAVEVVSAAKSVHLDDGMTAAEQPDLASRVVCVFAPVVVSHPARASHWERLVPFVHLLLSHSPHNKSLERNAGLARGFAIRAVRPGVAQFCVRRIRLTYPRVAGFRVSLSEVSP